MVAFRFEAKALVTKPNPEISEAMKKQGTPTSHTERMKRALLSLEGLSVGDAFGRTFVDVPMHLRGLVIGRRELSAQYQKPPWPYTDDTVMAVGVLEVLAQKRVVDQDMLASVFARRFLADPKRGYGKRVRQVLKAIADGESWKVAAKSVFNGGSLGNGSAMRVAPLGAYFADDYRKVVEQARLSAEVTHMHPEGIAGAIAVAVASAFAWNSRKTRGGQTGDEMLACVMDHVPEGQVRSGIEKALSIPLQESISILKVTRELGNGIHVTCPDTVPFVLWCAAKFPDDYTDALWTTIAGLGDLDTTCAIVGGIVALSAGRDSIPSEWLRNREPLDLEGLQ